MAQLTSKRIQPAPIRSYVSTSRVSVAESSFWIAPPAATPKTLAGAAPNAAGRGRGETDETASRSSTFAGPLSARPDALAPPAEVVAASEASTRAASVAARRRERAPRLIRDIETRPLVGRADGLWIGPRLRRCHPSFEGRPEGSLPRGQDGACRCPRT